MNESLQSPPFTPTSGSIDPYTVAILHALKGSPGNILLALLSCGEPLGTRQLVLLTGWCESSVIAGLRKLALLGWVDRRSRYNSWVLSDLARSTVLPRLFPAVFRAGQGVKDGGNLEILSSPPPADPQLTGGPGPGNCEILSSLLSEHPLEDQDRIGNPEILSSLPTGDPVEDQDLPGNCMSYGSIVGEGSDPLPLIAGNCEILSSFPSMDPAEDQALAGNREIYSSNRTPDDARTACKQSSRASQGSRASKARASPARRCPPLNKRRASCDSCSCRFRKRVKKKT